MAENDHYSCPQSSGSRLEQPLPVEEHLDNLLTEHTKKINHNGRKTAVKYAKTEFLFSFTRFLSGLGRIGVSTRQENSSTGTFLLDSGTAGKDASHASGSSWVLLLVLVLVLDLQRRPSGLGQIQRTSTSSIFVPTISSPVLDLLLLIMALRLLLLSRRRPPNFHLPAPRGTALLWYHTLKLPKIIFFKKNQSPKRLKTGQSPKRFFSFFFLT